MEFSNVDIEIMVMLYIRRVLKKFQIECDFLYKKIFGNWSIYFIIHRLIYEMIESDITWVCMRLILLNTLTITNLCLSQRIT